MSIRSIGKFIIRYIELPFFPLLLLIKMYWFANEVGLTMIREHTMTVTIGTLLVIFSISFLFHRRARLVVLLLSQFMVSFIIFADLIYYRYFGDFITTPVLMQTGQAMDIQSSIIEIIKPKDVLYFIDVIIVLFIIIFLYVKKIKQVIPRWERVVFFALSLATGFYLIDSSMKEYTERFGTNFLVNMWSNESIYNATGHIGFHAYETSKFVREEWLDKKPITEQDKENTFQVLHANSKEINEDWFGIAEGKNVLIIQLESFQNFVINKRINGEEITPNLNQLVEETMYFSNFYHQTAQGRTSDAEFLVNTSLYPVASGSVYVRYPHNTYHALPNKLKGEGYVTRAYHAYNETFWNRDGMYRSIGFDDFIGKGDLFERIQVEKLFSSFETIGDEELFLEAVKDAQTENAPFYHFIIALTSHHPYVPMPEEEKVLNISPLHGDIFGDYLQSVHYVDKAIGKLVNELKKTGLWEETVVVIYGDHDNGVAWEERYANAIDTDLDEMLSFHTLKNVPFYIHIPGNQMVGEMKLSIGMIDVAPTLLELLGVSVKNVHLGKSIFDFEDHIVPFRDGSVIKGDLLYHLDEGKGSCMDIPSRELVSLDLCANFIEEGQQMIRASDNIIEYDLFRD